MTLTRLSVFFLAALVAVGCDSSDPEPVPEPEPVRLSGRSQGDTNVNGIGITVNMTLNDVQGNITGSGTLRSSTPVAVSITGSFVPPDFNLTLRNQGINEDTNFAGTTDASANIMTGFLNGSGFDNVRVVLTRNAPTAGPSGPESLIPEPETDFSRGITTFRDLLESETSL